MDGIDQGAGVGLIHHFYDLVPGGAGLGGGAAFAAAGIAEGGMSLMAGFAGGAAAAGALSPAGFASSSAMIRRIDARISSIEGSWTFAGCVISDSTSSTPNLHQAATDSPVPDIQAGIFIATA